MLRAPFSAARLFALVLTCFLAPAWAAPCSAESVEVLRVEEDWELLVSAPDATSTAPQVTCAFSPLPEMDELYASLELNHRSQPEFQTGGVQLQVWSGESLLSAAELADESVMAQPDEVISWTQVMAIDKGLLLVAVTRGDSATWGDFGSGGELQAMVTTELTNLNGYNPDLSAANSGVGFAGNRVARLVLKRVRVYLSTGEVVEDTTERVAHGSAN